MLNKEKTFLIYCITNTVNNKKYIGQTCVGLEKRWTQHCRDANKGSQTHFHAAIRKYHPDAFTRSVVGIYETKHQLNNAEEAVICAYGTHHPDYGYNLTFGGEGVHLTDDKKEESTKRQILFRMMRYYEIPDSSEQLIAWAKHHGKDIILTDEKFKEVVRDFKLRHAKRTSKRALKAYKSKVNKNSPLVGKGRDSQDYWEEVLKLEGLGLNEGQSHKEVFVGGGHQLEHPDIYELVIPTNGSYGSTRFLSKARGTK